ncbi:parathyroid hormone 2 receptor-like [Saccostrea cucullata]|uniref:parathyroid hormone 2 receptor-like n=1 Tax=Saccostrea cuccullata TaxID=36930 RepID=UPI002ED112CE
MREDSKQCTEDGSWFVNPFNKTWTNFSLCLGSHTHDDPLAIANTVPALIEQYVESVRLMYNIGYGISLASLVIAVAIMIYFKKLHCARNTIHVNLFVTFILRAIVTFIKEHLLVESVGFPGDIYYDEQCNIIFRNDVIHWECRLFFTLFNYTLAASYMWIFVEAIYLQFLLSGPVFTTKNRTKWFMLLGWLFPVSFVLPWVLVRIFEYNELCWNIQKNQLITLIIYGPITVTVLIQFIIFINIVRILFTKLHASNGHQINSFLFKRLAKSTLILIPLFGVYYVIYSVNYLMSSFGYLDERSMIYFILWWSELFFNSFIHMLVQTEFKKVWHRHLTNQTGSTRTTRSRTRNSVKQPPTSNGMALHTGDINHDIPTNKSDSTLVTSFQNETYCESENRGIILDTDDTENETSSCIINKQAATGNCDKVENNKC